jgi:hypothetical protein
MTRQREILAIAAMMACVLLPSAFGGGTAAAQTTATVKVNCNHGERINTALGQHPNSESLIVEIQGMCSENVLVTRDRVTLRGTDPANDGIQAVANATQIDAALWVRSAHQGSVENLKLTGGFVGLLATEVSSPHLRMVNCRLEGNTNYGVALEASLLQAEDSILTSNGFVNAGIFQASRFRCTRCTLSDPGGGIGPAVRSNIIDFAGSSLILSDTTLNNGGISSFAASMTVNDCTINGFGPSGASIADGQSTVNLTRTQLSGPINLSGASNTVLLGVTQTAGNPPNSVDNASFVRIGDASPAVGGPPSIPSDLRGFTLRNFSNGSLLQSSHINGSVNCGSGANTFCANPANVSGTSNCALCPKP